MPCAEPIRARLGSPTPQGGVVPTPPGGAQATRLGSASRTPFHRRPEKRSSWLNVQTVLRGSRGHLCSVTEAFQGIVDVGALCGWLARATCMRARNAPNARATRARTGGRASRALTLRAYVVSESQVRSTGAWGCAGDPLRRHLAVTFQVNLRHSRRHSKGGHS